MRTLTLLLCFSCGAILMWTLAPPLHDRLFACAAEASCAESEVASPPLVLRRDLKIVLYDPRLEPRPQAAGPYFPGWSSAEVPSDAAFSPKSDALVSPSQPRLQLASLKRPGARGVCATIGVRVLSCLAFWNPEVVAQLSIPAGMS